MADIKNFFTHVKDNFLSSEKTNEECVKILEDAASNGNEEANGLLGDFYFAKGGKENRKLALKYYTASETTALTPLRRKNVAEILKCNFSVENSKKQSFEFLVERKISAPFITIDLIDDIICEARNIYLPTDSDSKKSKKAMSEILHWFDDFILDSGYKIEPCADTWIRWICEKRRAERLDNVDTRLSFVKEYIRLKKTEQKIFSTSDIDMEREYEKEASKILDEKKDLLFSPEEVFVEEILNIRLHDEDLSKPLPFETFCYLKEKAVREYCLSETAWDEICSSEHISTVMPNVSLEIPDLVGDQLEHDEVTKEIPYDIPESFVKDIVAHADDVDWLDNIVATFSKNDHLGKKFRIPLVTFLCNGLSEIPYNEANVCEFENVAKIILKFYKASGNVLGYENIFLPLMEPWKDILSPSFVENVKKFVTS